MAEPAPSLLPLVESIADLRGRAAGDGTLAVAETTVAAGLMPPLHVHEADEAVHVLEGAVILYAGDDTAQLRAGESSVVEGGVPHTLRAISAPARLLTITLAPSVGLYEDFVQALGTPVLDGGIEPTAEDEAALDAFAAPSGIEVLGPPGMLPAALDRPGRRVGMHPRGEALNPVP